MKSKDAALTVCAISFQDFQLMLTGPKHTKFLQRAEGSSLVLMHPSAL